MAIESEDFQIRLPDERKRSVQPVSAHTPGPSVDFEMRSIPFSNFSRASGEDTATADASQRISSDENREAQGPRLMSEQVQTIWHPYKNRFRVMAACLTSLGNGMNDSAPGALIASVERDYNIAYGTVSIIFVCNALGFVAAAFFISALSSRIGRSKSLMISEALLILGYTVIATTPPFPAVCASFFFLGIGMAMNLAICQVFCANLANNTAVVGAYQGAYGIGGTTGPLIATALISHGSVWSRFYTIEVGLASLNFFVIPWAFWNYESESDHEQMLPHPASEQSGSTQRRWKSFKELLSDRTTVLGSLFIFAYQGSEVAISGWVIAFLVQFRNGDPSKVGYVSSGFWAGITLGRFTLSFMAHHIGERLFVFIVTVGALIVELLICLCHQFPVTRLRLHSRASSWDLSTLVLYTFSNDSSPRKCKYRLFH